MNRRPIRDLHRTAGRLALTFLLSAALALLPSVPAIAAGTTTVGTSAAGGAVAPSGPATVATTVPTVATTTPTIATTTPAAPAAGVTAPGATSTPGETTTPGATTVPGSHVLGTPTTAKKSGGGKLSDGAILAAILAGLIALACLVWGAFRITAFEPHWLLSTRHSVAEAGFRAAATWDEFTDWLRLGH
ncbi:MAG TPA: hypothetical protein VH061_04200 [Solirubrobacteraceae bacterium]|jgi:hypothetical protein|nr:hypothetical protein [Solirubrobacteraceae bacterium]